MRVNRKLLSFTVSLEIQFASKKSSFLFHKLYLQALIFFSSDRSVNGILRISKELETVASLARTLSFPQISMREAIQYNFMQYLLE